MVVNAGRVGLVPTASKGNDEKPWLGASWASRSQVTKFLLVLSLLLAFGAEALALAAYATRPDADLSGFLLSAAGLVGFDAFAAFIAWALVDPVP